MGRSFIGPLVIEGSQAARFLIRFPRMGEETLKSVSGEVRRVVRSAPDGTFFTRKDFVGSDRAVESALSRLVAAGELRRVRKGLYWRGVTTRFGMTPPSTLQVALEVAGPGSGPTGVAAAQMLGLTTQVPSITEVAVPGRAPDPVPGVRFRSRSHTRHVRGLRPVEVAVLELLRDPSAVESPWPVVVARIGELASSRAIRPALLSEEADDEQFPAVRARLHDLALA